MCGNGFHSLDEFDCQIVVAVFGLAMSREVLHCVDILYSKCAFIIFISCLCQFVEVGIFQLRSQYFGHHGWQCNVTATK